MTSNAESDKYLLSHYSCKLSEENVMIERIRFVRSAIEYDASKEGK